MRLQVRISAALMILVLMCALAFGQTPQKIDDPLGRALEVALVEVEHCRAVKKLTDEELKAQQEQISDLNAILETEKKRIDTLKTALKERAEANQLDDTRVKIYEERVVLFQSSIADYQKEIDRLRKQRGFRVKVGTALLVGGIIIGGALGFLLGSK